MHGLSFVVAHPDAMRRKDAGSCFVRDETSHAVSDRPRELHTRARGAVRTQLSSDAVAYCTEPMRHDMPPGVPSSPRSRRQPLARLDALQLDMHCVLAFLSDAVDRKTWVNSLRNCNLQAPGGYVLNIARLNELLPDLLALGWLDESTGMDGSRRFELSADAAVEVLATAAEAKRLDSISTAWRARPGATTEFRTGSGALVDLRIALAHGSSTGVRKALANLAQRVRTPGEFSHLLYRALGLHPRSEWLEALDPEWAKAYATSVTEHALWDFAPVSGELLEFLARHAASTDRAMIAHLHALRGDPQAARAVTGLSSGRRLAPALMATFWSGDHARVLELVAESREADATPSKLHDVEAVYYMLSCVACSEAQPRAIHLGSAVVEATTPAQSGRREDFSTLEDFFASVLQGTRSWRIDGEITRRDQLVGAKKVDWLNVVVRLFARQWRDGELAPEALAVIDELSCSASTAGFEPLVEQLRELARAGQKRRRNGSNALAWGHAPRPRWQLVLEALDEVDAGVETPTSNPDEELRWQVEADEYHVDVKPRWVTTTRAKKGKVLAIATLWKKRPDFLDADDLRVLSTARPARPRDRPGYRRTASSAKILDEAALPALIDHPRVVDETGRPLTVVAAKPELRVERRGEDSLVSIHPPELSQRNIAWQKSGDDRLLVYQSNPKIDQILRRIGAQPLEVPAQGETQLVKTLAHLASVVHISGTGPVSAAGRFVEADATIVARLAWNGRALELRFATLPLGKGGPLTVVGEGDVGVLAHVDGELRSTARQPEREAAAVERILAECPRIDHTQVDRNLFLGPSHEDAYEMLLELVAAKVELYWNSNQSLRVPRVAAPTDTELDVRQGRDWLRVGVRVAVDGEKFLHFRELLERRLGDSRFIRLGPDEVFALTGKLARTLTELASLGPVDDRGLRAHPVALPVVEAHTDPLIHVDFGPRARRQIKRLKAARKLEPRPPESFRGQLRDYQLEGFRWLARLAHAGMGACLADDMGLGKTVQALALLARRAKRGPALVVAPASVVENWIAEARRFVPTLTCVHGPELGTEQSLATLGPRVLVLCSYGVLTRNIDVLETIEFSTVVFDEAHALKNPRTHRTRAAARLGSDLRIALTGTPIENHLSELWSLMNIILPGLLGEQKRFESEIASPIRGGDVVALDNLRLRLRPFVLRRHKTEVLDELPELEDIVVRISPTEDERAFYEALRKRAERMAQLEALSRGEHRMKMLAEITRLRQAAIDPRLIDAESGPPGAKIAALIERLVQLQAEGHRALVFTQFLGSLDLVGEALQAEGITYLRLDGSTPTGTRTKHIEAFQNGEADVFLISLKAGGQGINLTAADYVFHLDPWWNPAVEDQATSRAHRMGRARPVTSYRLVTVQSIEEKILELHADKRGLASDLLKNLDRARKLQLHDLRALLQA